MSLSEVLFLGILGLVVFGPKKLVEVGQHIGQALAAFKKATAEFQSQLGAEIARAEKQPTLPSADIAFSPTSSAVPHGNIISS